MMMPNLMRSNSLTKSLLVAALVSFLAACGGGEGDDLDKFMATAANDMSKGVEPLPEVLPYAPLQYNADGTLSDPFKARKAMSKAGALQPNTNRPKEALEAFPLEDISALELKLVASSSFFSCCSDLTSKLAF